MNKMRINFIEISDKYLTASTFILSHFSCSSSKASTLVASNVLIIASGFSEIRTSFT